MRDPLIPEIKQVSLRDQVIDVIQKLIIAGEIQPGSRIVEDRLKTTLGVSRTPVREALILLERDGLVEIHTHKGCFVRNFSPQEIRDIFIFRTNLENLAIELVIDNLTEHDFSQMEQLVENQYDAIQREDYIEARNNDLAFHTYPVHLSQNAPLIRAWRTTSVNYTILWGNLSLMRPDGEIPSSVEEHRSLLDAIRSRDLNEVKELHVAINRSATEYAIQGLLLQQKQED